MMFLDLSKKPGDTDAVKTADDILAELDAAKAAKKRDEELIASLLYYHLEDFADAVASDGFTQVIKAAFRRLGLKYEPFGPDAMEVVEQRRNEAREAREAIGEGEP